MAHGIVAQTNPFLVKGRLLFVRTEPPLDVLQFASYAPSYDAELRFWMTCYAATRPANGYPTNAILVLARNADGGIELLGQNAEYSIYKSNPENERLLTKAIRESNLLPKRDAWLSREKAIQIAKASSGFDHKLVTSRREAFGWSVYFEDPGVIGGHATVIVDDTGRVLATYPGY